MTNIVLVEIQLLLVQEVEEEGVLVGREREEENKRVGLTFGNLNNRIMVRLEMESGYYVHSGEIE